MAVSAFGPARTTTGIRSSPYERLPPMDSGDADGDICQFFAKAGWCKYGEQCRFAHIGEAKPQEVCQFFVKSGWCKWGSTCKHMHIPGPDTPSEPEGPGRPPTPRSLDPPSSGPSDEVCQFFAKAGWCKYGDGCRFLHPGVAPQPASLLSSHSGPPSATAGGEVCQFFAKAGWCKFGETCKFVHQMTDGAPPRPVVSRSSPVGAAGVEVCEFFAKAGWCKWGDSCKFLHTGNQATNLAGPTTKPVRSAGESLHRSQEAYLKAGDTVCKFFSAPGGCRHGEACPFDHIGEPGSPEECEFFKKSGWCKWGDTCKFVHSEPATDVRRAIPDDETAPPSAVAQGSLAALQAILPELRAAPEHTDEVCQFFQKSGWCKWGDTCKYVHVADLEAPAATADRTSEVCNFFAQNGWCKFGNACRFLHIGAAKNL